MESGQKLSSSVVGQACPPLKENLYQKFRKLPCLPKADILSIPAFRQAGNYGTKRFKNSFPTPDLRYFSLTLADFQSAKYSI
jgi:hypothetical protein